MQITSIALHAVCLCPCIGPIGPDWFTTLILSFYYNYTCSCREIAHCMNAKWCVWGSIRHFFPTSHHDWCKKLETNATLTKFATVQCIFILLYMYNSSKNLNINVVNQSGPIGPMHGQRHTACECYRGDLHDNSKIHN